MQHDKENYDGASMLSFSQTINNKVSNKNSERLIVEKIEKEIQLGLI